MTSEPIRDPAADQLLTPQNSAFIIIDYQPVQVNSIASMDRQLLVNNIVGYRQSRGRLRPADHPFDGERRDRPQQAADPADPQGARPAIRPMTAPRSTGGRTSSSAGGRGDRPQEADHDRAVDRSLPDLPRARCARRKVMRSMSSSMRSAARRSPRMRRHLRRMEQAGGKLISVPQLYCELQRDWSARKPYRASSTCSSTGGTAGIQFSYDRSE